MKSIICLFIMCDWVHICNIGECGLWQCTRCKTLSKGKVIQEND